MTTTDTIDRLCAAIDAGRDDLLPILADALEDAGRTAEANGLRRIGGQRPHRPRLRGQWRFPGAGGGHWYPSRSAAYLALAVALTETTT
jgi:hypothetical protein